MGKNKEIPENNIDDHDSLKKIKEKRKKSVSIFELYKKNFLFSFRLNYWLSLLLFISAVGLITTGLIFYAHKPTTGLKDFFLISILVISGIGILFTLLIKNPMKQTKKSIAEIFKINLITIGFSKQIEHSEILLSRFLEDSTSFDYERYQFLMKQINNAVDSAIELYTLSDLDSEGDY